MAQVKPMTGVGEVAVGYLKSDAFNYMERVNDIA